MRNITILTVLAALIFVSCGSEEGITRYSGSVNGVHYDYERAVGDSVYQQLHLDYIDSTIYVLNNDELNSKIGNNDGDKYNVNTSEGSNWGIDVLNGFLSVHASGSYNHIVFTSDERNDVMNWTSSLVKAFDLWCRNGEPEHSDPFAIAEGDYIINRLLNSIFDGNQEDTLFISIVDSIEANNPLMANLWSQIARNSIVYTLHLNMAKKVFESTFGLWQHPKEMDRRNRLASRLLARGCEGVTTFNQLAKINEYGEEGYNRLLSLQEGFLPNSPEVQIFLLKRGPYIISTWDYDGNRIPVEFKGNRYLFWYPSDGVAAVLDVDPNRCDIFDFGTGVSREAEVWRLLRYIKTKEEFEEIVWSRGDEGRFIYNFLPTSMYIYTLDWFEPDPDFIQMIRNNGLEWDHILMDEETYSYSNVQIDD